MIIYQGHRSNVVGSADTWFEAEALCKAHFSKKWKGDPTVYTWIISRTITVRTNDIAVHYGIAFDLTQTERKVDRW